MDCTFYFRKYFECFKTLKAQFNTERKIFKNIYLKVFNCLEINQKILISSSKCLKKTDNQTIN